MTLGVPGRTDANIQHWPGQSKVDCVVSEDDEFLIVHSRDIPLYTS